MPRGARPVRGSEINVNNTSSLSTDGAEGLTRWRHHGLLPGLGEGIASLPDREHVLIVSLASQDALSIKAVVVCVFIVEGDLQRGFRVAGARRLCLQLLLRSTRLVGVNVLLVVVRGQHGCRMCWDGLPAGDCAMSARLG